MEKDQHVGIFEDMDFAKYWLDRAEEDFDQTGMYIKYKKGELTYANREI